MKKAILWEKGLRNTMRLVLLLFPIFAVTGCKETIDASNFAVSDEPTVYDYLKSDERFTDILSVFERVNMVSVPEGSSATPSSIANTLQTRGNYTCFIPTNEAVRSYVEGLTGSTDVSSLSYEQAENMAKSCLIDNGDISAYESPDFPTQGSFALANMNDRILTCEQVSVDADNVSVEPYYLINGEARVIQTDIEVTNGIIHVVDHVIAPSSNTVPEMIKAADNMLVFSHLLEVTGWDVRLMDYRDMKYEEQDLDEVYTWESTSASSATYQVPQRRYLGYTIFAEPDDVYASDWGIELQKAADGSVTNWDEVMATIGQKAAAIYPNADASQPLTSEDNPVNRFVAYHILEGRIAYDRFVFHFNEYNYRYIDAANPANYGYTVDVWDYYATIGSHRGLLKVLQVPTGDYPIYLNRVSEYDNDTYQEVNVLNEGIRILATNGSFDNNALNGFYYPITRILTYDNNTRTLMGNERIRIDMATMLPEMSSNNIRGGVYTSPPNGYFSNLLNMSDGTRLCYLAMGHSGTTIWYDSQGDEFLFGGIFDFVLRLPPVPVDGTYEIRMGCANSPKRGMAQIYFGEDPDNLPPAGLPIDMRQSTDNNPNIPWVEDTGDEVTDRENDRNMRNQGYMKGPKYYMVCDGMGSQGGTPLRDTHGGAASLRRILTTQRLEADKTYYLRFKSALDQRDAQFFLDYFELVNSSVYNGTEPEDIW